MSKQEDFDQPEKLLEKTWEIDNEARISKKVEMKRKFNRNQKRITLWDIQLSSLTSLVKHILMFQLPRKRNCKYQHYLILVDIHVNDNDKTLPIIHCLPKIRKTPIGWRFFIASKTRSTKALLKVISKVFKLDHHLMEDFPNKSWFYSITKNIWVVQNSFQDINIVDNINRRKTQKIFQPWL